MKAALRIGLAAIGLAAVATPTEAQRRAPGWIGISFEVSNDRRGRNTRVEITDVHPGSPAAAAGVQVGDRLLAVNDLDRPSELSELSERLRLRVGDRVRMVVRRDGRREEIRLRAAEQPSDFRVSRQLELSLEPDSMVETMVRAMDSLRIRIVQGQRREGSATSGGGSGRNGITVVSSNGRTTVQAPFEFFVFRGEAHDSLRQEMDALNRVLETLERRRATRALELERTGGVSQASLLQDTELRRIRTEMEEVSIRSAGLRAAMADAARETAGFAYSPAPSPPNADQPRPVRERSREFRPLTPYILGRNRVAGAEVVDLRPELAAYFEVGSGVLVVDVAPRTPAAISGLVPGDVITRMDQVVVRSVDDLRFGVSQAGDTVPLTLIRRGASIQVLLRR